MPANCNLVPSGLGLGPERNLFHFFLHRIFFLFFFLPVSFLFALLRGLHIFWVYVYTMDMYVPGNISLQVARE